MDLASDAARGETASNSVMNTQREHVPYLLFSPDAIL